MELDINSVDYGNSIAWVMNFLAQYNITGTVIRPENFNEYHGTRKADWEHDDGPEGIVYKVIIPNADLQILLSKRWYQVRSIWLSTENGWYSWSLSMVSLGEEESVWHSLDLRILKENH